MFIWGNTVVGRVSHILARGSTSVIVLDVFQLNATRHALWNMPVLARHLNETSYMILPVAVSASNLNNV